VSAAARVAIIGAGAGGLAAALHLAAHGVEVLVFERGPAPGGKIRALDVAGRPVDSGPTVLTMRWIFERMVAEAGSRLEEHLELQPLDVLARHAWTDGSRLDLFPDVDRSAAAIAAFAGRREGARYRQFAERSAAVYAMLADSFIDASRPSPPELVRRIGGSRLSDLWRIRPFTTLWRELSSQFHDPRLRQLFGRYATYCGSSPFEAPATLMLIAHVEQQGVWVPKGGMVRLAAVLADIAESQGARFRYSAEVTSVEMGGGRARGVTLATGERIEADAVICNADCAALATGLFGRAARSAVVPEQGGGGSLSAITWSLVATPHGFPLHHHNVFFSRDYTAEFDELFRKRRLPSEPTVYICAADRLRDDGPPAQPERLFCLVNAPSVGHLGRTGPLAPSEIAACETRTFDLLARCGLRLDRAPEKTEVTTPAEFANLFPATGGALYGPPSHGWRAPFSRPRSESRIEGLYLAGGSVHPGPGVPMAALSGRRAAERLLADLASMPRSRTTVTSGGTSTASATTAGTASRS